jgi:hypothetical protein
MIFALLALVCAAAFTGAAIYINFAEQPARLRLEDAPLLVQWKHGYQRGALMQAPLALAGCVLGLIAWWQSGHFALLLGAILMIANWPWTLLAVRPTYNALLALDATRPAPQARELVIRWGHQHAIRSILGALATLTFLLAFQN